MDFTAEPDLIDNDAWRCRAFAPVIEREFLEQGAGAWLRSARNWLLETVGLGVLMIWGAALSGPDAVVATLVLQYFAGLAAAIAAFSLPRLSLGWPREGAFCAVALVVVALISAHGWWMSPAYANRYVMGSGLALSSSLLLVPLRFWQSLALGGLGLVVLAPITIWSPNPAQRECWDLLGFTALVLPLLLRVRMEAERDQRRLFLLRRHENLQRQALSYANSRLEELSATDPLTGVANRRCFDAALLRALDPTLSRLPLLLLLDVDHFKCFNDTYGHPAGDACLRLLANAVRAQLRDGSDLMARVGGEEFAVLLPGGTEADAGDVAERIRQAVEDLQLPHSGRPDLMPVVTVSVGAAAAELQDTADKLISRADQALYAAKKAGRNQVYSAQVRPESGGIEVHAAVARSDIV